MRWLLACLLLLLSVQASFAQLPGLTPAPNLPKVEVPEELQNPRATVRTLLDAVSREEPRLARQTLDLNRLPLSIRESEGSLRARQLAFIIDRTAGFRLDKVPEEDPEGNVYLLNRYQNPATRLVMGEVELRKGEDGAWRFSQDTVDAIPGIFNSLQDAPSQARLGLNADSLRDPGEATRSLMPAEWRRPVVVLEPWQWVAIGLLIGFSFLAVPILHRMIGWVLRLRLPFLKKHVTESSERGLKASIAALIVSEAWRLGLPYVDLALGVEAGAVFVLRILSAGSLAWLLLALFDALVDVAGKLGEGLGRRAEHILIPVVRKFGKTIILIGTALFLASAFDINLAGVIAGLGIGGLVVALAAKDSVENLFGSLTILFDMPFGVGDWIRIGDIDGVVEQINLRSTRIRTFEDSVITLPNSNLIKASVENMGQRRYRRLLTNLGLDYDTTPEKVDAFCEALREHIRQSPLARPDVVRASFYDYQDSALQVQIYMYIQAKTYEEELQFRHEFMLEIKRIASRIGVSFAFPTQTVYFRSEPAEPLPGVEKPDMA